jgi:5-methylcytosine-specific restriction endonuclease McrA
VRSSFKNEVAIADESNVNSHVDFLYSNQGKGTTIELRPGVAFSLRQFYGLIGDLVRGAWLRYIRRHNHDALGTTADLSEFLFGSERSDLTVVREILEEVQIGKCFYCESPLRQDAIALDHFIPWSKYPVDLGHNFVLAHKGCNTDKADHLAAADFLEAWVDRNLHHAGFLAERFGEHGVLYDLGTSCRVATWAYRQTYTAGGLTWRKKDEMSPLPASWQDPLVRMLFQA